MVVNEKQTIWMEKYRPQVTEDLVLPEDIKQKFIQYAKNEDIPNIGLWSSEPGCVLPGTYISAEIPQKFVRAPEAIRYFGVNKKEFQFIKRNAVVRKISRSIDEIDVYSVRSHIVKLAKASKLYKDFIYTDRRYENKFLKYEYWLYRLNDYIDAYKKTKFIRRYKEYFDIDYNLKKFQNFKTKADILKKQFIILYRPDEIKTKYQKLDSKWTMGYWLWCGYTEEEARSKISDIQKANSKKYYERYTKKERSKFQTTSLDYWIKKGYDEDTAKEKLIERQTTFSLTKCIEKYGEEKGVEIFNDRQKRWQKTLDSKSEEEKLRINRAKASTPIKSMKKLGRVYYIKIYNHEIEFWKIGITTKSVKKRFSGLAKNKLLFDVIFEIEFDDIYDAWMVEQTILKNKNRTTIIYNKFRSTECFLQDIRIDG